MKNLFLYCLAILSVCFFPIACSDDQPQQPEDKISQEELINAYMLKEPFACFITDDLLLPDGTYDLDKSGINSPGFTGLIIPVKVTVNDKIEILSYYYFWYPFPIARSGAKFDYNEACYNGYGPYFEDLNVKGIYILSDVNYDDEYNLQQYNLIEDYNHTEAGELTDYSKCNFEFKISPNNTGKPRLIVVHLESENLYELGPSPNMPWRKRMVNVNLWQYAE